MTVDFGAMGNCHKFPNSIDYFIVQGPKIRKCSIFCRFGIMVQSLQIRNIRFVMLLARGLRFLLYSSFKLLLQLKLSFSIKERVSYIPLISHVSLRGQNLKFKSVLFFFSSLRFKFFSVNNYLKSLKLDFT